VKALFSELIKQLKDNGMKPYRKEGTPESGWMIIDMVDTVIHILSREAREYYAIEAMWEAAPRLG